MSMRGSGVVAPWACLVAIAGFAAEVSAGGTTESGSSGEESTGADTSDGGSGSTGADESSGGESGDGNEGSCGSCSGHDGAVTFTNISDGAVVPSPFVVHVDVASDCGCDDCGCFETSAEDARIEVDGVAYGEPCGGSNCEFELALAQGPHVITAYGIFDYWETSAELQVTVEGSSDEGTATESGGASASGGASESSGDAGLEDDEAKSGCGCRANGDANGFGALAIGLLALLRRRRLAPWAAARGHRHGHDGCACRADASGPSSGAWGLLLLTAFARRRSRLSR